MIIYRETRSARVTIQPADGPPVVVENLDGTGLRIQFSVTRTMSPAADESTVRIFNLGPGDIGRIETQPGDPGLPLTVTSFSDPTSAGKFRPPGPESAAESGFSIVDVEAGYDGSLSQVSSSVSTRVLSSKEDNTSVTEMTALDNIDGVLFGRGASTFSGGTPLYAIVDHLRRLLGLGKGNFNLPLWTALTGTTKIPDPYTINGQAFEHMTNVFQFLRSQDNRANVRWFQDLGEFFIYRDDGFIAGLPIALPPIKMRPARESSGAISVSTFLAPSVSPGRLVLLAPDASTRADIPAGVYRCDAVSHDGDTGPSGQYTTAMKLYPTRFEVAP